MSKRKNISQEYIDDSDDPEDQGVKSKKKAKKSELGVGAAILNKKAATASASAVVDEDELISLSAKKFCSVRSFKGRVMVDIREYYQDDCGELKPGKKGIALMLDQWKKLKDSIELIDQRIDEIGG